MTKSMEERISELNFSKIEKHILSQGSIEYLNKPPRGYVPHLGYFKIRGPGWYIVFRGNDGTCYDAIGPYESQDKASHVMRQTRSE